MVSWIFSNYKAFIAIFGGLITLVFVPIFLSIYGFILSTNQTRASVEVHEAKISGLEKSYYGTEAVLGEIKSSLTRIEEREYNHLKRARDKRMEENK